MKKIILLLLLTAVVLGINGQGVSMKGYVYCAEHDHYLPAASILLQPGERHLQSDENGFFALDELARGNYLLTVQYIGYETLSLSLSLQQDTLLHIHLHPEALLLKEVMIEGEQLKEPTLAPALAVQELGRHYLMQENSESFAKTLATLPGVASMDIGAGFSKPVIRGMGFNRIAVSDRGIVQQNQQWGADHGLEIDQYDVDNVRIYKGPMSLHHGSDAMGGVIEILPPQVPQQEGVWGDLTLSAKSNNDLMGISAAVAGKSGRWYLRGRMTLQHYGDYRVPADTVTYLTRELPLYGRRMKNTAGREQNLSFSVNYGGDRLESWLHTSYVSGKNGFFPGAHGIPSLDRLQPDGSVRNLDMPYSSSGHLKLISNNRISLKGATLQVDMGMQQNRRAERSPFHTHYGNQSPPAVDPNLELHFLLDTYTLNSSIRWDEDKRWRKQAGIAAELQHNRVGGYSFLLPAFDRITGGAWWMNEFVMNERLTVTGGLRYDIGSLTVEGFHDPLLETYLLSQQMSATEASRYAQRAEELQRRFGDWSGALGVVYRPSERHVLRMNIGKSFRYPTAGELASNGVHHGAFRHEQGNNTLNPERGIQWDGEYRYRDHRWEMTVSPFLSHFGNYIFLEPSGIWSMLPHTGQIYRYRQARAVTGGGELAVTYRLDAHWELGGDLEVVRNRNLEDDYALPFSPPDMATGELTYNGFSQGVLAQYRLRLQHRYVSDQQRVAKNEEATAGTSLWDFSAHLQWRIGGRRVITDLQVQNIFDRPFLNHLSFYRRLNIPEPGRNVQLIVRVPIG